MKKTIVTHINPDLDAITSVWLLKRFDPDFKNAEVKFVPAGKTYQNQPVDSDPDIVHVDTGLGKLDHHQTADPNRCAAKLVFNYLKSKYNLGKKAKALLQITKVANAIDHFQECYWPEAKEPRFAFFLEEIFSGIKLEHEDSEVVEFGLIALDGVFKSLQSKIDAKEQIDQKGKEFSLGGKKALAVETKNDEVLHLGQKLGYILVVRRDPKTGKIRIAAQPRSDINLGSAYRKIKNLDPDGTWYLHPSRKLLLNSSGKNPDHVPTKLDLDQVVKIIVNQT